MRIALIAIALVFPLVASSDTSEGAMVRDVREAPDSTTDIRTDGSDFDACYEKAAWAFDEGDRCPAGVGRGGAPCAAAQDCKLCVARRSAENCGGDLYLYFEGEWKLRPGHIHMGRDC